MTEPIFHVAGMTEYRLRRFYSEVMSRLGFTPHTVRAQGARFVVDTGDFIDCCIAWYGLWEGDQLERLAILARERKIDVFLDIGANTGFYSVMFAVKKLAGRVIAFEPDPGNHARLMANLNANGLVGRVEAMPFALGDREGEVTLYEGARGNRGESTIAVPEQTPRDVTFSVRQAAFDSQFDISGATMIVKMDVEGYEFEALAGMERTLRNNQCFIQVEHYGERGEDLKAQMAGYGYRYLDTRHIDLYFTNMPDVS
ncbi:MAG: FkbM family methyltransferase [Alphaproteobacteria bacterium]|nr:FkbM family methyltransferase [Alphaproteobacteria bacterium]